MFVLWFLAIFVELLVGNANRENLPLSVHHGPFLPTHNSHFANAPGLTFFWINLDQNQDRRNHMEQMFQKYNVSSHQRVSAVRPDTKEYSQLVKLEKPCKRNTPKDLAVIMSHLKAIYSAVYFDRTNPHSEYAVILEDDIRFLYSINFSALIDSAPKDFTILQLTTSNPEALTKLWKIYTSSSSSSLQHLPESPVLSHIPAANEKEGHHLSSENEHYWHKVHWTDKTRNGKTYLYWSAQAYIINKKRILERFLSYVLKTSKSSRLEPNTPLTELEYRIINSFDSSRCTLSMDRPCILSNCLFADSYIFAGGNPTYVSTIPLVTGAKVGLNSTIHQAEVDFHKEGFQKIKQVTQSVKSESFEYPSYLIGM